MDPRSTASATMRIEDWNRLEIRLWWAYEGPPAMPRMDDGLSAATTAWFLKAGSVEVMDHEPAGASLRAHAGEWVFPTAGRHAHRFSDDAEIVSVVFSAQWPDERWLYPLTRTVACPATAIPQLLPAGRRIVRLARRLMPHEASTKELMHAPGPLGAYLDLSRTAFRWVATWETAMHSLGLHQTTMGGGDPRVARALQRLESIPFNEPLNEPAIARAASLSLSQLNRLLLTQMGLTLHGYWHSRRLRYAQLALSDPSRSVKQVAHQLGFDAPSNFSNWFRKSMGVYPRAYQRAAQ